jgi:hypothetical protein
MDSNGARNRPINTGQLMQSNHYLHGQQAPLHCLVAQQIYRNEVTAHITAIDKPRSIMMPRRNVDQRLVGVADIRSVPSFG